LIDRQGGWRLFRTGTEEFMKCALDFIDITAVLQYRGNDEALLGVRDWVAAELASGKIFPAAPFLPRYEATYVQDPELNISGIQFALKAAGFDTGAIDGKWGRRTQSALEAFQKAEGLKPDGQAGFRTLKQLTEYLILIEE